MDWTEYKNAWELETGTAIKGRVVLERDGKYFVGVGVVRDTGRGLMYDFEVTETFDTLDEAQKFAEAAAQEMMKNVGEIWFKYARSRWRFLRANVTEDWQCLSNLVARYIAEGGYDYYTQERMRKSALALTKHHQEFDMKLERGRWYIKKGTGRVIDIRREPTLQSKRQRLSRIIRQLYRSIRYWPEAEEDKRLLEKYSGAKAAMVCCSCYSHLKWIEKHIKL